MKWLFGIRNFWRIINVETFRRHAQAIPNRITGCADCNGIIPLATQEPGKLTGGIT